MVSNLKLEMAGDFQFKGEAGRRAHHLTQPLCRSLTNLKVVVQGSDTQSNRLFKWQTMHDSLYSSDNLSRRTNVTRGCYLSSDLSDSCIT